MSAKRVKLCIAGGVSALAWLYLAFVSQGYAQAGLPDLLCVAVFCFVASVAVWWLFKDQEQIPIFEIVAFALLFRLIGVFTFPVLEDDFYRYLWDGFVTVKQGTPYGIAPSAWFDQDISPAMEGVLNTINYPDVATVYGPSLQWLFALSYLIAPAELWPLKLLLLVADLILLWVLLKLAPAKHLILYAWSPLVIKEFVISTHPDLFGAMFLGLALLAYQRKADSMLGVFLALAAGVKVFALIILPFLFLFHWRAWLSFSITAVLIALPFGLLSAWLPDGLAAMGQNWLFNALLYELFALIIGFANLKIVLASLFFTAAAFYGLRWLQQYNGKDALREIPRGDYLFAGLLIILPVLNPWYLIWLLPFAVIWPSAWAWVTSVALLFSYASGINLPASIAAELQDYQHPNWVLAIEFGLIILALCWDGYRSRKKFKTV